MWKRISLLICTVFIAVLPGNAELLQVDLSIFGMD